MNTEKQALSQLGCNCYKEEKEGSEESTNLSTHSENSHSLMQDVAEELNPF